MRYKEAVFLYRDGDDDFTMWSVDLPENDVAGISTNCKESRGELSALMSQLPPFSENTANQLHLLMKHGEEYVLCSKEVPFSFIEQHQHEGYSVRGNKESVLAETEDLFQDSSILESFQGDKNMTDNNQIQELLDSPYVTLGYVYRGGEREKYWFDGTPENIASFLMHFPDADQIILTDRMDILVLNTIGTFIDTCPDQEQLSQVLTHLIPMQMGETEPKEVFCPTDQEVNDYCNLSSQYDMTFS